MLGASCASSGEVVQQVDHIFHYLPCGISFWSAETM